MSYVHKALKGSSISLSRWTSLQKINLLELSRRERMRDFSGEEIDISKSEITFFSFAFLRKKLEKARKGCEEVNLFYAWSM